MRLCTALGAVFLGLAAWGLLQAQAPWKEYPALEYENFPVPTDWNQKTEWTRARLRYPDIYGYPFVDLRMRDGKPFPGYWTMDYPRSDRHLMAGHPPADPHRHALGGTGCEPRWHRRSVQLAHALCGRSGALATAATIRRHSFASICCAAAS